MRPTKAQIVSLALGVSLAFNITAYAQHVNHDAIALAEEATHPANKPFEIPDGGVGSSLIYPVPAPTDYSGGKYVRVTDKCDMKYGSSRVVEGVLRYNQVVFEMALEDLDDPQTESHVDLDNDYLCWLPRMAQPAMRSSTENVLYFAWETAPAMALISDNP